MIRSRLYRLFHQADSPTTTIPTGRQWDEREIADFLSSLRRLDLVLTNEQTQALAQYIRSHARRSAIVLNAFASLIPVHARIFSIGSMPNQLELLFEHYLHATVIGSTYSPQDHRDKFTAVYQTPAGQPYDMDVYLRDFTRDPLPLETYSCDVVLAFEVVEHFWESPLSIFREALRVLKPGGYLLLSTPNVQHWHRLLSTLNGLTYPDVDFSEPIESRHTHIFSFRELQTLLTEAGFVVVNHFFADPWDNARQLQQFDLHTSLNSGFLRLVAEQEEFQHECTFIAAQARQDGFVLTMGWHAVERTDQNWWCWTSGRGQIDIFTKADSRATLNTELYSIQRPNRVEVIVNGHSQVNIDVTWDGFQAVCFELALNAGENTLELVSVQPGVTLPTDGRQLAIGVKNLTIKVSDGSIHGLRN